MKKQLQARLVEITNAVATLENKEKLDDADKQHLVEWAAEGKSLRAQLTALEELDAVKAWAKGSAGSAVKTALSQESTDEGDREQEQRAQEAATKSAYKSAFEAYLRGGWGNLGPNDRKILKTGQILDEKAEAEYAKAMKTLGLKALGETSGAAGGALVPEQFEAEVLKKEPGLIGLNDIVRQQDTSRDVLVWPTINYTTDNKKTAPHALTFTGEVPSSSTVHRVTDQTFGEVRIPVNLAMASQLLSLSLTEDSAVDVMGLTAELFRENILQDVDLYLATGTGAGQPEGLFINATAQTNYVIGGAAASLTSNGLKALYWQTPAQYRKNGRFVMSSATAEEISKLTDGNGRYVWEDKDMFGGGLGATQSDGVVAVQPRLFGMPIALTENAPTVTTNAFPISFGDHKGYVRANRVGMTIKVLNELYAETDQVLFLLRMRFGGGLAQDYKIKLLKVATS